MLNKTGAGAQHPIRSHWMLRPSPQSYKNSKQQSKRYRANTITANSKTSATKQTAQQPQPAPSPHLKQGRDAQSDTSMSVCGSGTSMSVCAQTNNKDMGGRGYFPPGLCFGGRTCLSPRRGPARRHLSTLSAWGGVRCLPAMRLKNGVTETAQY